MNTSDIPFAGARKCADILMDAIACSLPWALAGSSGVGKTGVVEGLVAKIDAMIKAGTPMAGHETCEGCILWTLMGPQYDEYTLRGVQTFHENASGDFVTRTAAPSWKVTYDELRAQYPNHLIVCFIDELGVTSNPMQASILELINCGRIDQQVISDFDKVVFLSAYNRQEDGASFFNMSHPLALRFGGHTALKPNVEDLLVWGHSTGKLAPEVDLFLSQFPDCVVSGGDDGDKRLKANAISPRGWEFVSRILERARAKSGTGTIHYDRISAHLQSRMPSQILGQFQTAIALAGNMPRWTEVQQDPEGVTLPVEPVLQAMTLRSFASQIDEPLDSDAYLVFANRCGPESVAAASSVIIGVRGERKIPNLSGIAMLLTACENGITGASGEESRRRSNEAVEAARGRLAAAKDVTARRDAEVEEDEGEDETLTRAAAPSQAPNAVKAAARGDFEIDFQGLL